MDTDRSDASDARFEELVCAYIERINAGEVVDAALIEREEPELAAALLVELDTFFDLDLERKVGRPIRTLGDFELLGEIGRGGMGVVYEAWQNSMNRRVALKVLPGAVASDRRAFARFVREAQVAGSIHHPNVVPVYGLGLEAESPYYSMEIVDGRTLASMLARARDEAGEPGGMGRRLAALRESILAIAPNADGSSDSSGRSTVRVAAGIEERFERAVAACFAGVAEGLHDAHQRGIVHRDLKPSNLILDVGGRLRVLDFGLARLEGHESLTLTEAVVGTPRYMSPEQARAKREPIDHRTDVYSLGATMYETLTTRPPFVGKTNQDTLSQILQREPAALRSLVPGTSRDIETIVLKCLAKEPRDRYGTAEALAQDLRRFARGEPIEARPMPAFERWLRRARRQRLRIAAWAAVALLVVVAIVLGGLLWTRQREADLVRYRELVEQGMVGIEVGMLTVPGEEGEGELLSLGIGRGGEAARHRTRDGSLYHARGSVERAVGDLERAADLLSRRPEAWLHLSRGLRVLGRSEESREALARALDVTPEFLPALLYRARLLREDDGELAADALLRQISVGLGADGWQREWLDAHRAALELDWDEADRLWSELLASRPAAAFIGFDIALRLKRGRVALRRGERRRALRDFAVVREGARGTLGPSLLLAKAYYLDEEPREARCVLDELLALDASAENALAVVALELYHGAVEDARRTAEAIVDPGARAAALARVACREWDTAGVEAEVERAFAAGYREPWLYELLGEVLVKTHRADEARELTEEGLRRYPENHILQGRLHRTLYFLCEYEEMISRSRSDGFPYYRLGRLDDAIRVCDEQVVRTPRRIVSWLCRANCRVVQGELQSAIADYARVAALDPEWSVHNLLPRVYSPLTRPLFEPWWEDYQRAFGGAARRGSRDPFFPGFRAVALARKAEPDLDLALELAREAVALAGGRSSEMYRYLGDVHAARGELDLAVRALERADELPGDWSAACEDLRRCRQQLFPRLASCASIDAFISGAAPWTGASVDANIDRIRGAFDGPNDGDGEDRANRARYLEACLLERGGRLEEAVRTLEDLISGGPIEEVTVLRLARLLGRTGRRNAALRLLEERCLADPTGAVEPWGEWMRLATAAPSLETREIMARLLSLEPASGAQSTVEEAGVPGSRGIGADVLGVVRGLSQDGALRINCGGREYRDSGGRVWAADRFHDGGAGYGYRQPALTNSMERVLYHDHRGWREGVWRNAGYRIPVPSGRYAVVLHFCLVSRGPHKWRFGVAVEGRTVREAMEPGRDPGFATAFTERCEVSVRDGLLEIGFEQQNAGPPDHRMFVNALEIIPLEGDERDD